MLDRNRVDLLSGRTIRNVTHPSTELRGISMLHFVFDDARKYPAANRHG
jgi:hypothetical protein